VETLDNKNSDNFSLSLNVVLEKRNGIILPYPAGLFTVTTMSGKNDRNSVTMDFSMNDTVNVVTSYNTDTSNNILDRKIIIKPKETYIDPEKSSYIDNVIPTAFTLKITFDKIYYKLGDLTIPEDKKSKSNYIDSNNNLIIADQGTIYDNNNVKIGNAGLDTSDPSERKTYTITIDTPNDEIFIETITILFIIPISKADLMMPELPALPAIPKVMPPPAPPAPPIMSQSDIEKAAAAAKRAANPPFPAAAPTNKVGPQPQPQPQVKKAPPARAGKNKWQ